MSTPHPYIVQPTHPGHRDEPTDGLYGYTLPDNATLTDERTVEFPSLEDAMSFATQCASDYGLSSDVDAPDPGEEITHVSYAVVHQGAVEGEARKTWIMGMGAPEVVVEETDGTIRSDTPLTSRILDDKEFLCGSEDVVEVVKQWAAVPDAEEWIDARCFSAATAASLDAAGIAPDDVDRDWQYGGQVRTIGYWAANGDLSVQQVQMIAEQDYDNTATVWTDPDSMIEFDRDGKITYDPDGTLPAGSPATPGGEDENYPLDDPRFQAELEAR